MTELFGKTDNSWQIYKQKSLTFFYIKRCVPPKNMLQSTRLLVHMVFNYFLILEKCVNETEKNPKSFKRNV